MNQKTITIVLAGITAVLFAFCVFLLATDDRRPPVIKIGVDAVSDYREGEGTDKLLADVSAFDEKDGDVTDTLAVETVIPLADGASAKIYFVAMDKSGNIGKESMIISYTPSDEHIVSAEGQNTGEPGADSFESAEEVPASETKTEETKGDPSGETPYVMRYTESENTRSAFVDLLNNSEEKNNKSSYLNRSLNTAIIQDMQYNPLYSGDAAEQYLQLRGYDSADETQFLDELERSELYGLDLRRLLSLDDNASSGTYVRPHPKVGPNDPCICGSGKKFKKCYRGTGKYD